VFELKALHPEAVPAAQEKALRYRLLNEPRLAESICKDILAVQPAKQETVITLILALSDQLGPHASTKMKEALALTDRLEDEYHRHYYSGIIHERWAKGQVTTRGPASGYIAYDWFRKAMACYEKAEALSPPGNDDAILRWNTCARLINGNPHIRPAPQEHPEMMLE
jgi:hypothetical protein